MTFPRSSNESEIEWLGGTDWPELTEREEMLVRQAREEGYHRGYTAGDKHGHDAGYECAMSDMTTLSTAFEQRQVRTTLEHIAAYLKRVEHNVTDEMERSSVYWETASD